MDDQLIDRHRGDDATVTISLRTALDLWMFSDGETSVHNMKGFEKALGDASRAAGFDGITEAYHRCGPGMLTSADGKIGRRATTRSTT